METRILTRKDSESAKALWKEAFGDSDAFVEWYFANKVLPGNSVGIFDGELVCALHMIPFKISVLKKPIDTMFIAGAATAQSRRGEGLMRTLLLEALKIMRDRGVAITHLYPFKHGFYEKFGWETCYFVKSAGDRPEAGGGAEIAEVRDASLLRGVYEEMTSRCDGYVIRGKREWDWRLGELFSDGGKAAAALERGRARAYMLYYAEEEKINVIETAYCDDRYIGDLSRYLEDRWRKKARFFLPCGPEEGMPGAMARVVDARRLLRALGLESALEGMRVTDAFAEWNNTGEGGEVDVRDLAFALHTDARAVPALKGRGLGVQKACIFEQY